MDLRRDRLELDCLWRGPWNPLSGPFSAITNEFVANDGVSKATSGTTTSFNWSDTPAFPLLLSETTGATNTDYVYGPNGQALEEILPSGSVYYYSNDNLGSIRALADSSGTAQDTDTYDPYGNVIKCTKATVTVAGTNQCSGTSIGVETLMYAGQVRDDESNLYYLRARYYDPTTAQFLTIDPAVAITMQPYGYTAGDPINATDPTGEYTYDFWYLVGTANHLGGNATHVASYLISHFRQVFPFSTGGCASVKWWEYCTLTPLVGQHSYIRVVNIYSGGFEFQSEPGSFEGSGGHIWFGLFNAGQAVLLHVNAQAPNAPWYVNVAASFVAYCNWQALSNNLHNQL